MTQRHLLLLSLLLTLAAFRLGAQTAPQGFNYQCIVRDATGATLNNQTVTLLFTVRSGAANGPVNYSEKQTVSTNEFGLVNLIIGQGSPLQGTFSAINWGNSAKYLTVSVETAPNVFDELGSTQLMSVPYALYSQNSANGADNWGTQVVQTGATLSGNGTSGAPLEIAQQGAQTGQVLKWDGTKWLPQDDISDTGQNGGTVTQINTGLGLTGGPITTSGTISLENTAVAPGVYGGSAQIPVITVDQTGRITDVFTVVPQPSTVGITGAAGINVQQNGVNFTITNTGDTNPNDDLTTSSTANGDVTGPFSDLQIKADAVGSPEIAGGAVGNSELANAAVTTTKIADQAVTAAKLDDMGAANGQVLKWNGTEWAPAADNTGSLNLTGGTGISVTGTAPNLTITNTGDTNAADDVTIFTQANGDVAGPFADLQIKANAVGTSELNDGAVTGAKIAQQGASNGQVLKWNGTTWAPAADNTGGVTITGGVGIDVIAVGNNFTIANSGDINPFDDITTNSTAGGDLTGPFDNLQIKPNIITNFEMATNSISTVNIQNGAVTGAKIAQMSALPNQVLKWNGTAWAPAVDETGGDNWGNQTAQTNATLTGNGTVLNPLGIAQQGATSGQVLKWNGTTWAPAADNNTGGDNWGTQFVIVDSEFVGKGTAAEPLELAGQGAAPGQVLKWNGASWTPGDDNNTGGDNWGAQVVVSTPVFTGNGTAATPLNLASQGAASGQVLKWNGTSWAPAADNNSGPDNWGTQVVQRSGEFEGDGTAGNPLELSGQGAAAGQVLKWNGASWAPSDDNDSGGDDWGVQAVVSTPVFTGNGTAATPLNLASQGASAGQVLKWNGASWAPAADNNSGPDNWGTQVVQRSGEFEGDGTAGNPLELAGQGAAAGQVLKWNGASWTPGDDNNSGGDDWGAQVVEHSTELAGDGTTTTPLALAPQGAAAGQVLKWNGTSWSPADDLIGPGGGGGNTYAAGTGISITGTAPNLTINNTGDLSNTNELQTLSIAGNDLTLSNGGGTVPLPIPVVNNYNAGTGISITGTAPNFTINNLGDADSNPANELQTLSLAGSDLSLSNGGGTVTLPPSNNYSAGAGINITGAAPNFTIINTGDADNSPTNEIQTLSLTGNDLNLSNGGGSVTLPTGNTYTAGTGISITGTAPNFTINNLGDADADPANELQDLALNGTTLTITGTNSSVSLDTILSNAGLGFWDDNGANIFNTNSGNVGVGTNTPIAQFHVKSNGEGIRVEGTNAQIGFSSSGGAPTAIIRKAADYMTYASTDSTSLLFATANAKSLFVDGISGNVGIGAHNTGAAELAVYHDVAGGLLLQNPVGNSWEFYVSSLNGNLQLYNNTLGAVPAGSFALNGVYTPSDRRLKKDVSNLSGVLDKLMQLKPVRYHYLPENADSQLSIGFLAQDVQTYFPELVAQNPARDGKDYLSLNYAGFGVLAVKAVQEQQGQIEALKQENDNLRKRLESLEQRLNQLSVEVKK